MSQKSSTNNQDLRARTAALIKARSFRRGEFTLASGAKSNFYLDLKPTALHPEGAALIARLMFARLREVEVDLVGGLELGAVPLAANLSMLSYLEGRPLPAFVVRKQAKDHGTQRAVESPEPLAGKKVVIVEDVSTKGGSAMQAVEAVRAAGATVSLVLTVVDRQAGAAELFAGAGVPFASLFTAAEFLRDE